MGKAGKSHAGRGLTEKEEQFSRLISAASVMPRLAGSSGSIGAPGNVGGTGERSAIPPTNRCTIRLCAPQARGDRGIPSIAEACF